ncbi:hypothetical protein, partial [Escherichia coli]|uniref:hypothetical protein n=1 Tax=Escherichia coli TaxID=562 RepID=UPI003B7B19B2
KMTQEAQILMADLEKMDPLARAWHELYRDKISKEVMAAQAAQAASMAPSASMPPPASMPPAAVVQRVPAMGEPPATTEDDDIVEVQPPPTALQ